MNYESQPLQLHEIQAMKSNPVIIERVIQSYRLMLDFYGMRLISAESGLVDRVLPPRNFETRYRNLVRTCKLPSIYTSGLFFLVLAQRVIAQLSSDFPDPEVPF